MFGLTKVDKLIIDLSNNNTSGASELVRKVVSIFQTVAEEHDEQKGEVLRALIMAGHKIIKAQPSMAPMFNCVNDLLVTLEPVPPFLAKEAVKGWAKGYIAELEKARSRVIAATSKAIKARDTIVTISYSTLVRDLLVANAKKELSVIVSEARPMNEGMKMAEVLGLSGITTTLVVDAALTEAVKDADMVLVGADAITERGVVNKIGTRSLALEAKANEVPFFVAAERNKYVLSAFFIPEFVDHTSLEVTHIKYDNVKVRNIYFEETPLRKVTGFFTEDGVRTVEDIMGYLRGRKISKDLLAGEPEEPLPEPLESMELPEDL
jgi:translation initiation factor 2B subunit (eIF-2B alpha/beta/delta family)